MNEEEKKEKEEGKTSFINALRCINIKFFTIALILFLSGIFYIIFGISVAHRFVHLKNIPSVFSYLPLIIMFIIGFMVEYCDTFGWPIDFNAWDFEEFIKIYCWSVAIGFLVIIGNSLANIWILRDVMVVAVALITALFFGSALFWTFGVIVVRPMVMRLFVSGDI